MKKIKRPSPKHVPPRAVKPGMPRHFKTFEMPGADACSEPWDPSEKSLGPDTPPFTKTAMLTAKFQTTPEVLAEARTYLLREESLLTSAQRFFSPLQQAMLLVDLGQRHYILGQIEQGDKLTAQAEVLFHQLGDRRMEMECRMRPALFHERAGDYAGAVSRLESMLQYGARTGGVATPVRYNLLMSIAEMKAYLKDPVGAARAGWEAWKAIQGSPDREQEPDCLMTMMVSHKMRRQWPQLVEFAAEAVKLFERRGARDLEEQSRYMLIIGLENTGRFREAAEQYEVVLRWTREMGSPRDLLIERLIHTGDEWVKAGDLVRGEALLREALPLIDAAKKPALSATVRMNLGTLATHRGGARESLPHFQQALAESPEEVRHHVMEAQGDAMEKAGDTRGAAARYKEALARARRYGDEDRVTALLLRVGDAVVGEDRALSLSCYREWLQRRGGRSADAHDALIEARVLERAGLVCLGTDQPREAAAYFGQQLELMRELGDDAEVARALERRADARMRLSDAAGTMADLQKAAELYAAAGRPQDAARMASVQSGLSQSLEGGAGAQAHN